MESQHHRAVEVGQVLWRLFSPHLLKQGHLLLINQECLAKF